jgi:hypothetical protein
MLYVEIEIYKYYVKKLLERYHTPNLIGYVASTKCKNYIDELLKSIPSNTVEKSKEMIFKSYQKAFLKENLINVLILETAKNSTKFYKWLKEGDSLEFDLLSALFQLFYTLECFNRVNLRHNDLYFGNIFI